MRDPFVGHHAPGIRVRVLIRGRYQDYAHAFTINDAKRYVDDAQHDGYGLGDVRGSDGTLLWQWPEPDVLDDWAATVDGAAYLEGDVAGFAPVRRRRRW